MVTASHHRLINRFYQELWNSWNHSLATELLAADVVFRGSLGVTVHGIGGFLDYMRLVQEAFPDFHNAIEEIVEASGKVFACLAYRGTHLGPLFGIPPTNRSIAYSGAALFTIAAGKIASAWVLGDALGVLRQLEGATARSSQSLGEKLLEIAPADPDDMDWAAQVMASSDPWKTLGRDLPACRRAFQDRTVLCFIARFQHERSGFLLLRRRGVADSPYIKSIGVAEKLRGHGIGRQLIRFAESLYCREARSMFVCVSAFNPRARRLYERLGYSAVGELKGYITPEHSEILLEKRLSLPG